MLSANAGQSLLWWSGPSRNTAVGIKSVHRSRDLGPGRARTGESVAMNTSPRVDPPERIRSALDILAVLPKLVGWYPHDSMVVQAIQRCIVPGGPRTDAHGPGSNTQRGSLGPTMRLDFSGHLIIADLAAAVDHAAALAARTPKTDAVCIAFYHGRFAGTGVARRDPGGSRSDRDAFRAVAEFCRQRFAAVGVEAIEVFLVGRESWWSALEEGSGSVPEEWRRVEPRLAKHATDDRGPEPTAADSSVVARSASRGPVLTIASPEHQREVATACGKSRIDETTALELWLAAAKRSPRRLSTAELGIVLAALHSPLALGLVVIATGWGRAAGLSCLREFESSRHRGLTSPEGPTSNRFYGVGIDVPRAGALDRGLRLAHRLAEASPAECRVLPLFVAGWFSWAAGKGSTAAHYLELAQKGEPEHPLVSGFLTTVTSGCVPEWVGRSDQDPNDVRLDRTTGESRPP